MQQLQRHQPEGEISAQSHNIVRVRWNDQSLNWTACTVSKTYDSSRDTEFPIHPSQAQTIERIVDQPSLAAAPWTRSWSNVKLRESTAQSSNVVARNDVLSPIEHPVSADSTPPLYGIDSLGTNQASRIIC